MPPLSSTVLAALLLGPGHSPATNLQPSDVLFHFDRANFQAVVPDLCNQEDFESPTADLSSAHDILWACTEVAYRPGDIEGGLAIKARSPSGVASLTAGHFGQPTAVAGAKARSDLTILQFSNEPRAVGFDVYTTAPRSVSVDAFDAQGTLLGSTTITAGPDAGTFVGIECFPDDPPLAFVHVEAEGGVEEFVDDLLFSGHCDPVLGANAIELVPGDQLFLSISETGPQSLGVLFIRSVDGVPARIVVGKGPIPGILCMQVTVPDTPPIAVGLEAYVLDPATGSLKATNRLVVSIR